MRNLILVLFTVFSLNLSAQWSSYEIPGGYGKAMSTNGTLISGKLHKNGNAPVLSLANYTNGGGFTFMFLNTRSTRDLISFQIVADGDKTTSLSFLGEKSQYVKGMYLIKDDKIIGRKQLFDLLSNSKHIHVKVRSGRDVVYIASFLTSDFIKYFNQIK